MTVHAHELVEQRERDHALGVERGAVGGERAAHGAEPSAVCVRPLDGFGEGVDGFRLYMTCAVHVLGAGPVRDGLLLGRWRGGLRAGPERHLRGGERGDKVPERAEV